MRTSLKFILSFLWITLVSVTIFLNKNTETTSLLLENTEALAQGEVSVPGVCAVVSNDICLLFDDGYFLTGVRVA